MNIIFGDALDMLPDNYTILELDTFILPPDNHKSTAYCVVEKISLQDFPVLESYRKVHGDLMQAYRDQNWEYCQHAIKGLIGRWNGELDSFYEDLLDRVNKFSVENPGPDWTGVIVKT